METPEPEQPIMMYNQWLQFVKPKLNNMLHVLKQQYEADGAPPSWVSWTLEKSQGMLHNDTMLVFFVETFLKHFWYTPDPNEPLRKIFDTEKFQSIRQQQIAEMARSGGIPEGVDWEYEISPVAAEKISLYMAMLCDSHDSFVLGIKNL